MRTDLLAIAAQDMENRLRPMPIFPLFLPESRPRLLGPSERQALDIGKRYGVYQDLSRPVSLTFASWNQMSSWLCHLQGLQRAASSSEAGVYE